VAGKVDLGMETNSPCCCVVLVSGQKRLPVIARVIRDSHSRSQGMQTLKIDNGAGTGNAERRQNSASLRLHVELPILTLSLGGNMAPERTRRIILYENIHLGTERE
jgi:hypothetical protein